MFCGQIRWTDGCSNTNAAQTPLTAISKVLFSVDWSILACEVYKCVKHLLWKTRKLWSSRTHLPTVRNSNYQLTSTANERRRDSDHNTADRLLHGNYHRNRGQQLSRFSGLPFQAFASFLHPQTLVVQAAFVFAGSGYVQKLTTGSLKPGMRRLRFGFKLRKQTKCYIQKSCCTTTAIQIASVRLHSMRLVSISYLSVELRTY